MAVPLHNRISKVGGFPFFHTVAKGCYWPFLDFSHPNVCGVLARCYFDLSSYPGTGLIGLRSTLMTSFYLNYLFTDPTFKYSPILRYWELGLQHIKYFLVGATIWPIATEKIIVSTI